MRFAVTSKNHSPASGLSRDEERLIQVLGRIRSDGVFKVGWMGSPCERKALESAARKAIVSSERPQIILDEIRTVLSTLKAQKFTYGEDSGRDARDQMLGRLESIVRSQEALLGMRQRLTAPPPAPAASEQIAADTAAVDTFTAPAPQQTQQRILPR